MKKNGTHLSDRRNFLRTLPIAAAAGMTLADLLPSLVQAQAAAPFSEANFQVFPALDLAEQVKTLAAKSGPANSKRLFNDKNFMLDLWVEKTNAGKEYEWHEHRDHIVEILDGTTDYELGGTPQNPHSTGPGEWLAPTIEGATKVTLKKGDTLIIRRGTAHKRTTAVGVTFTLAAPVTPTS